MTTPQVETVRSVLIREVIEVQFVRGAGVTSDPVRIVTAYYDRDGNKLAEHDPAPGTDLPIPDFLQAPADHQHQWVPWAEIYGIGEGEKMFSNGRGCLICRTREPERDEDEDYDRDR